jgi:DNA-binding NtrC family response regulator
MSDHAGQAAGMCGRAKLMVIDEARSILALYQKELGAEGYVVVTVQDPLDAPALFLAEHPDLVIFGVSPRHPGVQGVIEEISSRCHVPLVLNSYFPGQTPGGATTGVQVSVEKSSDLSSLRRVLNDLVTRRQAEAAA